jgi:hypothetical protein
MSGKGIIAFVDKEFWWSLEDVDFIVLTDEDAAEADETGFISWDMYDRAQKVQAIFPDQAQQKNDLLRLLEAVNEDVHSKSIKVLYLLAEYNARYTTDPKE